MTLDERTIAKLLAAGRIGVGVGLLALPQVIGGRWVGPDGDRPGTRVLARALGVRDLALGAGVMAGLRQDDPVKRWLALGVICDTVDLIATAAEPDIPMRGRLSTAVIAGAAALVGVRLVRALD